MRANATNRMRELREVIAEMETILDSVPAKTKYEFIAKLQSLQKELDKLKREHIHVVVDNS